MKKLSQKQILMFHKQLIQQTGGSDGEGQDSKRGRPAGSCGSHEQEQEVPEGTAGKRRI